MGHIIGTSYRVNRDSDFDFILLLFDRAGRPLPWPSYDWTARFTTDGFGRPVTASYTGGVCTGCFNDRGRIHIVADGHTLGCGMLRVEFTALIPDAAYPDGTRRVTEPATLGIEVVPGAGGCPCPGTMEAALSLPVIPVPQLEELEALRERTASLEPLPFIFDRVRDDTPPEAVTFRRGDTCFRRAGQPVPPGEGTYNEEAPDGSPVASTRRLFVCGQTVYRHSGRELINIAIERNPGQKRIRKRPCTDSHPGILYLDKGVISVRNLPFDNDTRRGSVSLSGLYLHEDVGRLTPLSELKIYKGEGVKSYSLDGDVLSYELKDDGDRSFSIGIGESLHGCIFGSGHPFGEPAIGVRYDREGRKIFYRTHACLPRKAVTPIDITEAKAALKPTLISDTPGSGGYRPDFSLVPADWEVQVWLRNRHGCGPISAVEGKGLRHRTYRHQWRWRRVVCPNYASYPYRLVRTPKLYYRSCLVRVRRHDYRGRRSAWLYLHMNFGGRYVCESRQMRQV